MSITLESAPDQYYVDIARGNLPESLPIENEYSAQDTMNIGLYLYGLYAYPCKGWLGSVAEKLKTKNVKTCLSVMSGQAWSEKFLSENYGISVIATDDGSLDYSQVAIKSGYNVLTEDAVSAIDNHPEADALFISWPRGVNEKTGCDVALEVINKWNRKGPVVYIGEPRGGECASDGFMNKLYSHYDKHVIGDYINPRFVNSQDGVRVYLPNKNDELPIKEDPEELLQKDWLSRLNYECGMTQEKGESIDADFTALMDKLKGIIEKPSDSFYKLERAFTGVCSKSKSESDDEGC